MGLCERISGGTWCRREAVGRERGDKGGGSTWNHTTILIYVRGESDDGGVPVPGAGRCSGRRVEGVEGRRRGLCIIRDWCLKGMHFQGLDFALKPLFVGSLPLLQKRPWRTASLPCNVLPCNVLPCNGDGRWLSFRLMNVPCVWKLTAVLLVLVQQAHVVHSTGAAKQGTSCCLN